MTSGLEARIREIEQSVGGYADIDVLADGNYIRRSGNGNFLSKHFSGELFLKVQVPAGAVCIALRSVAASATYEATGGDISLTLLSTLAASAVGYIGSYVGVFFPLLNKKKYGSYTAAMKAAWGYQIPEQSHLPFTMAMSGGTQVGYMALGLHPGLAAALGSFGPQKFINLFLSMASANTLYKHGGSKVVKGVYQFVKDAIGQASSYTKNVTEVISQYLTMPFKR